MLSGRLRGVHTSSAQWRARCISIVFLTELFLFSIGTASSASQEKVHQRVPVDPSLTPGKLWSISNSYRVFQEFEVHSTEKDSNVPEEVGSGSHIQNGLLHLLQRFASEFGRPAVQGSSMVEGLNAQNRVHRIEIGPRNDYEDLSGSSRRLLQESPGYSTSLRSSSPTVLGAALDKQVVQNEGRRVLAETTPSTEGVPVTQEVLLGPPAPPDLVKNDKQDWNQDYAEPDVHPPSSN